MSCHEVELLKGGFKVLLKLYRQSESLLVNVL